MPEENRTSGPRRFAAPIVIVVLVLVVAYIWLRPEVLRVHHTLDSRTDSLLTQLGDSALVSGDVPVAAVIIYDGKVIGEGYNTVMRDHNAAGHAEINAISDALGRTGFGTFDRMNRDSLVLVSTFEPCPMCRAAIALYRIKRVEFIKEKSLLYRLREDASSFVYRLRESLAGNDSLQENLFRKSPEYGTQHKRF